MKTFLLLLFAICATGIALAQQPKAGITLQISNPIKDVNVGWFDIDSEAIDSYNVRNASYAIGLLGNVMKKESSLRFRVNYTRIHMEEFHDISTTENRQQVMTTGQQNKLTLAPGIAWHLKKDRMDFEMGFELPITLHGVFTLQTEEMLTLLPSGDMSQHTIQEYKIPTGFSAGIGALVGFNYYVKSGFSFGFEYSPSLVYANVGGEVETVYQPIVPDPQYLKGTQPDAMTGITFFEHRFSLGVSVWF